MALNIESITAVYYKDVMFTTYTAQGNKKQIVQIANMNSVYNTYSGPAGTTQRMEWW